MRHLWLLMIVLALGGACLLVWTSAVASGPSEPLPGVTIGDRPPPAVKSVRVTDITAAKPASSQAANGAVADVLSDARILQLPLPQLNRLYPEETSWTTGTGR